MYLQSVTITAKKYQDGLISFPDNRRGITTIIAKMLMYSLKIITTIAYRDCNNDDNRPVSTRLKGEFREKTKICYVVENVEKPYDLKYYRFYMHHGVFRHSPQHIKF